MKTLPLRRPFLYYSKFQTMKTQFSPKRTVKNASRSVRFYRRTLSCKQGLSESPKTLKQINWVEYRWMSDSLMKEV